MFSLFGKSNFNSVSAAELKDKIGNVNLIDVREVYEYKSGHVPKAKNVPLGTITAQPDKYLDKEKEYYIICQSGARSASACRALAGAGYRVVNVSGGTGSYPFGLER
ncbi:MAG: Rhodanese-like domain protein [Anaerocolumna sp.]|jgi:rhodanese-related sulfurtransferase|nr:Rhodanese-like domain protein [Anaerocolumna sp.]